MRVLRMTLSVTLVHIFATVAVVLVASVHLCDINTFHDGVHADCSRRQLTSLPVRWPGQVVWLNLSHNNLSDLTDLKTWHLQLPSLRHLDLSYNHLKGILANNTLVGLHQLTWLSLHDNHLQGLEVGALTGLGQLTFLDLSNNHIVLDNNAYPPGVFDPVTSLRELNLAGNFDSYQRSYYPNNVFSSLRNLEILSIDTFSYTEFGSAFEGLVHLATLRLGTECRLKVLHNSTFSAFHNSSLREISMNPESLVRMEACAFCHLPELRSLSITNAFMPVTSALEALFGLQNQTMDLIDFTGMQTSEYPVTVDRQAVRFLRNICVSNVNVSNALIQRVTSTSVFDSDSLLVKCLQDIDLSYNRMAGDRTAFLKMIIVFKSLRRVDFSTQYVYSVEKAGWGLTEDRMMKFSGAWRSEDATLSIKVPENLTYVNVSTALPRWRLKYNMIHIANGGNVKTLDISYSWMWSCLGTPTGLTAIETLDLSGNYCYNVSETVFDHMPTLLHLRLSHFHINHEYFRMRAWRLFQKLRQLQSLDLSYNDLIHLDPHMLRAQRHLQQLSLAGNRLQSLSVDLGLHKDLRVLDVSHNMLPTLLLHERKALDKLAAMHDVTLKLRGNPLLCACSNLDMVRWLWMTSVKFDGDGESGRNYTCVTETGEVWDTQSVMLRYDWHWRRCVGQQALGAVSAVFLLQLLVLVIVYVVSRTWTHICYAWKVMKRLRLPRREDFRRDVYVAYADADWELACVRLTHYLGERHGVRLLLRAFEELPGSVRAENIVQHIDESWKVLLLVTHAFASDDWLCGFTVQQAQRSITDTMPDRVIVVLLKDPARLRPMASLERLLRMVPETNVFHVRRDMSPLHPVWEKIAKAILGDKNGR